ncbi:hypothetical protein [Burkholderia sp. BCC1047]|uniref:hypothetical protein n=1 Tax=Burkholderia sp. BCC1047 TaxID=2676299 RepID=UPI0015885F4B|nr:hypothetical protein [Burkholderia sp. BCC1047]
MVAGITVGVGITIIIGIGIEARRAEIASSFRMFEFVSASGNDDACVPMLFVLDGTPLAAATDG